MRSYELVLIIKNSLSEVQRKKILEGIKALLKDLKITKEDAWGEKAFAYSIKKQISGFYYFIHMEGDPTTGSGLPTDFEKKMFANEQVLRHLLIRKK